MFAHPRLRSLLAWSLLLVASGVLPVAAEGNWPLYRPHHPYWYAVHRGIYELGNGIAFLQAIPWVDPDEKSWLIGGNRAVIGLLNQTLPPPRWRWAVPCCYGRSEIRIPALKTTQESAGGGGLQALGDTGKAPPPASKPGG